MLIAPVVINGKPYTFFARNNLVENEDFIISIAILFTVIIIILVIGLILITRKLSIQLWKPFYEILKLIENFEIDKPNNQELNYTNIEEFNRLNQAINKLIEKNTFIFKSQKEFIENAAHELQTPIAIFKGKLETLLQRADVTKEQFKLLDELNNATTRLNKLNKNLLLLSKIESKQFNMPAKVNLGVIINNQLEFFKEQAIAKNIRIDLQLKQNIYVQINSFLSEILISNMFLNAINHNIQNGRIKITLDDKSLLFSNSGTLIPLEEHKLFDRFSKSNPSSKGNGLGLSIVKKIAADNNWKVKYYFKDNFHFFEIVF